MARKNQKDFVRFVQLYCVYLKIDEVIDEKQRADLVKSSKDIFRISAPYTCMNCNHKSGLSFIEKNHNCQNPMFDEKGIPIKNRVIEECNLRGFDFSLISNSVIIKNPK